MQTRRRFIMQAMGMVAGAGVASAMPQSADYEYSCIWMTKAEIEREIIVSPEALDRYAPCWVSTLEYKVDGTNFYCCQLVHDLKDEPKIKEFFLRAMRRKIDA